MQGTLISQRSASMLPPSAAMFSTSPRAPRVLKSAFVARSVVHSRAYPFGGRKLVQQVHAGINTPQDHHDQVASKPSWMQHLGKGAAMIGVAALLVCRGGRFCV